MIRKEIPNILTLSNLFAGTVAITMAFQSDFKAVAVWVAIAALFDFMDGFAARMLKAYSALGKELDSLADIVSFGVAPAAALFVLLRDINPLSLDSISVFGLLPYLAFLIPVFTAYRLAKFNIDERQATTFRGLPAPADGLFWIGYVYGMAGIHSWSVPHFIITLILILVMSWLMISDFPMFSLKVKALTFKGNERQTILIAIAILFVTYFGVAGIAWTILAYILLSFIGKSKKDETVK